MNVCVMNWNKLLQMKLKWITNAIKVGFIKEGCDLKKAIVWHFSTFNSVLLAFSLVMNEPRPGCSIQEHYMHALVWPQWWSFADVSKMKIIFWFDLHRCSHGPSKIGHDFRKQSGSKSEVFKNMTITKNILLNWHSSMKKNQKD